MVGLDYTWGSPPNQRVQHLKNGLTIALLLWLTSAVGYATMVSDDAKWRRGMFSDAVSAKKAMRVTPEELTAAVREGKISPDGEIVKEGEETAGSALQEGELRFKVDPDYGFIEYRLSNQEVSLYGGLLPNIHRIPSKRM